MKGEWSLVTEYWRPSSFTRRRCAQIDRFYAKCQQVAGGHHAEFPYMKRYNWLVKQDYR